MIIMLMSTLTLEIFVYTDKYENCLRCNIRESIWSKGILNFPFFWQFRNNGKLKVDQYKCDSAL